MPRPLRLDFDDAWHHVMNRGKDRRRIFHTDEDREFFLGQVAKATRATGVEVHAYALMPNHYHLLIHTPRAGLPRAMQMIAGPYAQRFHKIYGSDGTLCRGRYHSILIDSESHLAELPRYIHLNPVRAGLARTAGHYRWSSHRAILSGKPPPFLTTSAVLEPFGGNPAAFDRFVHAPTSTAGVELESAFELGLPARRLSAMLEVVRSATSQPRVPPEAEPILRFVCTELGMTRIEMGTHQRGRRNDAVSLLMTLLYDHGLATPTQLAAWFGYRSRSGVTTAIDRCRRRAETDPATAALLHNGGRLRLDRAA